MRKAPQYFHHVFPVNTQHSTIYFLFSQQYFNMGLLSLLPYKKALPCQAVLPHTLGTTLLLRDKQNKASGGPQACARCPRSSCKQGESCTFRASLHHQLCFRTRVGCGMPVCYSTRAGPAPVEQQQFYHTMLVSLRVGCGQSHSLNPIPIARQQDFGAFYKTSS